MDSRKKNILFLSPRYSLPLIGGDRLKQHYLIKYLAANYNLTLVTFYQGVETDLDKLKAPFLQFGVKEVHIIKLNPLRQAISCGKGLFFFTPLEISYYDNPKFTKIVLNNLQQKEFDLIFTFFMRSGHYLAKPQIVDFLTNKSPQTKKILIAEDCRRVYMDRSYKNSKDTLQKIVRFWEAKTLIKYEPAILDFFDIITLVSTQDISKMSEGVKKHHIKLLTNGTDVTKFYPAEFDQREGLIFVGKLDIYANELMIRKIVDEILPLIIKEIPDITFTIVGKNANSYIRSLQNKNIKLYEDVPDVNPFLQKSLVFIHPHNMGSGIQNKLIEAMASGCIVVTTPIGNQGINGVTGENLFLTTSNAEMASKIIEIVKNKKRFENISQKAVLHVRNTLSWDRVYQDLEQIIKEI